MAAGTGGNNGSIGAFALSLWRGVAKILIVILFGILLLGAGYIVFRYVLPPNVWETISAIPEQVQEGIAVRDIQLEIREQERATQDQAQQASEPVTCRRPGYEPRYTANGTFAGCAPASPQSP